MLNTMQDVEIDLDGEISVVSLSLGVIAALALDAHKKRLTLNEYLIEHVIAPYARKILLEHGIDPDNIDGKA